MQPIALIFINWNTADLLRGAVNSLLALPGANDAWEIVIVDNGSQDDSVSLLGREAGKWRADPRIGDVRIVETGANLGFGAAVNRGLEAVGTDYALILNTDIAFRNNAPHLLVDALRQDGSAALAAPRLWREDGSEQRAPTPLPTLFGELTNRSLAGRRLRRRLPANDTCDVPAVVGPCMAVDRQRVAAVGGFDERFFFFLEETDLCKRLVEAGHTILWVPAAEVLHLGGASANRRPYRARVQFYDSRRRYFRKHHGRLGLLVLDLGMFLRLTLSLVLMTLLVILTLGLQAKFRDKLAVYAVLWAWHLLLCHPRWGFDQRV